jgi:hypothetical protein
MEIKKTFDIIQLVLSWVIKIYFIGILILIVYNFNTHPEYFATISNKPPVMNGVNGTIYPDWYYQASTTDQCKPMTFLFDFYNRYLKLFIGLVVLYALINIGTHPKILEALKKIDEDENKKEAKTEQEKKDL